MAALFIFTAIVKILAVTVFDFLHWHSRHLSERIEEIPAQHAYSRKHREESIRVRKCFSKQDCNGQHHKPPNAMLLAVS
jgi:hypothetical protein